MRMCSRAHVPSALVPELWWEDDSWEMTKLRWEIGEGARDFGSNGGTDRWNKGGTGGLAEAKKTEDGFWLPKCHCPTRGGWWAAVVVMMVAKGRDQINLLLSYCKKNKQFCVRVWIHFTLLAKDAINDFYQKVLVCFFGMGLRFFSRTITPREFESARYGNCGFYKGRKVNGLDVKMLVC